MNATTASAFRFSILMKVSLRLLAFACIAVVAVLQHHDTVDLNMEAPVTGSLMIAQHRCSTTGLAHHAIPTKAVILRDGEPTLVSFDEGWNGRKTEALLAVCP